MTQSRAVRVFGAAVALFVLGALTGCAQKVTTPDSGFQTLEGQTTSDMLLVGYQQPALTESHWLQATTEGATPFFSSSTSIAPDSTGRLFGMVFDHTIADGLQLYRGDGAGGLAPVYDYTLRPFMKDLPNQRDIFTFQDANATGGSERYIVRGTLNGRTSHESPVSNLALASGTLDETMLPTSVSHFTDSLGTFSWTSDPRAVLYVVNIIDFNEISANRTSMVKCNLPTPVYPDPTVTQRVILTTDLGIPFDLRGQHFPIRMLIRVAAVDANFRIVNRLNPGAATLNTLAPTALDPYKFKLVETAPANFNAFGVLPMGGVRVAFDPFNQDIGAPNRAGGSLAAQAAGGKLPVARLPKGLTTGQARKLVESRAGIAAR